MKIQYQGPQFYTGGIVQSCNGFTVHTFTTPGTHQLQAPGASHHEYGTPCLVETGTIDGIPVCTVASQDGNPSPWVLFGIIDNQINNFVGTDFTNSPTTSGLSNGNSVQVGTFSSGVISSTGPYSLDIGQFCPQGGSCTHAFDLMIQYGSSSVYSHSENGYQLTNGGFINNGHTARGVVVGEHGLWGSASDHPNGYYATFCAYNGGCGARGNDFWQFSTHGVYPRDANSVPCGFYYNGGWKNCATGDNVHQMRYYVRSSDLHVS